MAGTANVTAVSPAATVVLVREAEGQLEVLLTQRAASLSFMGGLWVFPGGRMEPGDRSPVFARHAPASAIATIGARMLALDGSPLAREEVLGLCVAACRETFEECGVLLARRRGGGGDEAIHRVIHGDPALRAAASSTDGFTRLLVENELELELGSLVYWAHWVTPSMEKKRFDTRFFVVPIPAGQDASVDRSELTEYAWLDRHAIEARTQAGQMRMAPPTVATLQDLWDCHARHGGLAQMLWNERGREVPPILPKLRRMADGVEVVLPWDAEYASVEGEGCVVREPYPEYLATSPSRRAFSPGVKGPEPTRSGSH